MSRKEIQELLEKARRSLAAAEVLAQQGYNNFAVSRT
jgi:HEPN domain-containing protein